MNDQKWNKISTILDTLLTLSKEKRTNYLDTHFADQPDLISEVKEYLQSIEQSEKEGFLDNNLEDHAALFQDLGSVHLPGASLKDSIIGKKVGPYKIESELGAGGMGSVYKANRHDGQFNQTVAIKFINARGFSDAVVERFRMEQEILANLNHPNIATLFDGGFTEEGFPYLIMEYVQGLPIDEFCQKHQLSVSERLALFKKVLAAIKHAHSNLIIHRDLKPSNILIDEEQNLKVLDFGIAKTLSIKEDQDPELTQSGERVWTPSYAAPEQILERPSRIQTDIYGLGALLYSILTNTTPFDFTNKSLHEVEAMILKENPRPLAAGFESKNENQNTQETLQGDLESIVQKALRKEPEERYDSAGEFLEDIERFEQNLPVAAVNGSFQYKSRKFLRRNRRAIAISLTMLISAISFGTYHFYEISAERNRANLEAKKATQVTDYIIDLFALANPEKNQNDTLTVFNLLDLGLDKINDLEGQPELQLGFLAAIGDAYYRVGDWDRSGQIHIAADSFANEIYPENHFEVLKTSINRTKTYINDRNYNAALEYAEKAYRISEAYFPDNWYLKASALNNVGQALNYLNPDSAENYLLESIDLLEQNNARLDRILNSKNYLGINYRTRQEFEKAEAVYLDILESIKISESLNLTGIKSVTDNNLGYLYSRKKEYKKAEFHYREAQSYMVDIYGEAHPRSLILANNIRGILFLQNKLEEAKMHTLKQIEIIKNHYGELHWRTASEISSLGNSYLVSGEPQKSYQHYSRSFQIYDEVLGENHPWTIVALINEELSALLIENGSVQTRFDTAYDKLEQLISNGNFSTSAYSNLNASLNRFREYSTSDISEELDRINDLLSQDSES